jgi:hypothetical protein
MNRVALITLGIFAFSSSAEAQYFCAPGFGGGFAYRTGFGVSVGGPGFHFAAQYRGFYAAPILAYGWVPPVGPGYGPGFGNPFFLPAPPIVVGPAILPVANVVPAADPPEPILKGEFLVIAPKRRNEGAISPVVDRVAPRPERPPVFRFDPFAEQRVLGLTEPKLADPAAEAARQVKLARAALSTGASGTAIEHLERARVLQPDDMTMRYLMSQAQFATGQYTEAVATIRAGLVAHAAWATIELKPQDLFGKPARFDGMLGDLKRAVEANPDALTLRFLLAHQLWFSGDRDAAKAIFTALAGRLKEADAIRAFLK